jgi:prepilin-type N-terminal cleavage/methylation domain-containing protein
MSPGQRQFDAQRGFTALEALVAVTIFAVVMLFAITTFQGTNRMTRSATVQGDSQQSARLAVEVVTGDLRSLGYGIDVGLGQPSLVHASPWDVIFNANVTPGDEDITSPGFPQAMDPARLPATVPSGGNLYTPANDFRTGAETIRYTIDSSGDGILDEHDQGDDPEEATPNPRDYVLKKEIYGVMPDSTNGGSSVSVGLVRGPDAEPDGTLPTPLFTYWIDDDNDAATPAVLHGDADDDGELSQTELAALGDVPATDLALVTRVIVTITAEDGEAAGRPDYRTRKLVSSVSFRNQIRRAGVITGYVFQDNDGDGRYDFEDEAPIPGVVVRLDTGAQYQTNQFGRYFFEVTPGTYTVTELDPPGHSSTTPNVASVTVVTGSTEIVNYGDRASAGIGTIFTHVFSDDNLNGFSDDGERGVEGVVITLNTGVKDTTDANGYGAFQVPVGSYTVVETDSAGWVSTTSNVVEVTLAADGDERKVEFGDYFGGSTGTIAGTVYLDEDHDGAYDLTEPGIADVPILLSSGDSTVTNGDGAFIFTVTPGSYWVEERDLDGYSSSTPNAAYVLVNPDSTVELNFGDLYDSSINFTVVTVGQTDRALSIGATDLGEDLKGDPDIILGTESSSSSNLHVWHNQRKNANTAIVSLFGSAPSFSRNAGAAVQSLLLIDLNDDGTDDAFTGLASITSSNLLSWVTQTGSANQGMFPNSPTYAYSTSGGTTVMSIEPVEWSYYGRGLVVGTAGTAGGRVELWLDSGAGLVHESLSDLYSDSWGAFDQVTCVESDDFNGDGVPDLAVGQADGNDGGRLSIFLAKAETPWIWEEAKSYKTRGSVLALEAVDMKEDDRSTVDLLVGTSMGYSSGEVQLWLNDGEGQFGDSDAPSDWIYAGGEVLALRTAKLDPDVFPDVIVGLRTSQYSGALNVYKGTGYLPSAGTEWSYSGSGEVATLTVSDFNIDGLPDVAVGTRTAISTGELVVYFGTQEGGTL